jgi:hypothetical protein
VVAGDLVEPEPLNVWSEIVLVVWGLPDAETTYPTPGQTRRYTRPETIVAQLSEDPPIRLVDANQERTSIETELLRTGYIEL